MNRPHLYVKLKVASKGRVTPVLTRTRMLHAERLLELIIGIARADRIAVPLSAAEVGQLAGVDRHLSIAHGVVRGVTAPPRADVLRLRGVS